MANNKLLALPCCTLFLSAPAEPPSACTMALAATSFAWWPPCMVRTLHGANTQSFPRIFHPPPPTPHQRPKKEQGAEEKGAKRKKQPSWNVAFFHCPHIVPSYSARNVVTSFQNLHNKHKEKQTELVLRFKKIILLKTNRWKLIFFGLKQTLHICHP